MGKIAEILWIATRYGLVGVLYGAVSGLVCGTAIGLVLGGIPDCIGFGVFFGAVLNGITFLVTGVLWDDGRGLGLFGRRHDRNKPAVLFLCTNNAARSQMAEALLKKRAAEQFEAYSAGTEPKAIHPLTIRAMSEVGIDLHGHQSKHLRQFLGRLPVRYAIVVCQKVEAKCPLTWPGALNRLAWPVEDPAACDGSEEERLQMFRAVRDQIDRRIADWLTDLSVKR